ncbi:MAG: EAL domain-containing protein [Rhodoferax sp.]
MHGFRWNSLTTRITLGTVAVLLASIWSLTWFASATMRQDLGRELGAHQHALAQVLARHVQADIDAHWDMLAAVAAEWETVHSLRARAMRQRLLQRPLLLQQFPDGVLVWDAQQQVVAALARAADAPANPPDAAPASAAVAAALQQGRAQVSLPWRSAERAWVLMAVPITDADGQALGVIGGVVPLDGHGFLDKFTQTGYGAQGGYFLVAVPQRLILSASDRQRSLQALPAPGQIPGLDELLSDQAPWAVFTNPLGVEVLGAVQRLRDPHWVVGVALPTQEAWVPLQRQRTRMVLAASVLSLLLALLASTALRREFAPMRRAERTLHDMRLGFAPQQPLAVGRQDEVGALINGFNDLLQTLSEREAMHRHILDTSSVAIFLVDTQGRITQANQRMAQMFLRPLSVLVGEEYVALVHPSEREIGRRKMLSLLASEVDSVDLDRLYWRGDGTQFWGRLTGRRFYDRHGASRGLVGVIADITERKRLQMFEAFNGRVLELLASGQALPGILLAIVRGAEELTPQALCCCTLLQDDGRHLGESIAPSLPDWYLQALQGLEIGPEVGSCGAAAARGERVVVDDIQHHPYWSSARELVTRAGLGACWSEPLRCSDGTVLGTMAIYHRQACHPSETDLEILQKTARLASIAIERSRVAQRLRASEEHFRLLTESVDDVVWRMDADQFFTYISPADERLRGYPADEVLGHHLFDFLTEAGQRTVRQVALQRQQVRSADIAANTLSFELEQKCRDGGTVWTEVRSTAERDAQGCITGYHGITRDISAQRHARSQLQLAASVFTHAQEGILITAPDGTILDVNAAFSQICGYPREELLGRNPRLLKSGRQEEGFYRTMFAQLSLHDHWHGELWNRRKDGSLYAQLQTTSAVRDGQGQLTHYVALVVDITALKQQQDRLEHIAHFDALTHLPNRVLLADRMQQGMAHALRRRQPLAVVFLDLDGFKSVNDQYGHGVGDELLVALASRMRAALRDGDTLARLGGDEFVAVLVDLPDVAASVPLLQRLLQAAGEPVNTGRHVLQVSASLGVSFYPQDQEVDADQLLRQADWAMYQAKVGGKNRYHVFDAAQDKQLRGQRHQLDRIRQALAHGEFVLHYQPKVNMRTGALLGAEALIRWQHPEQGLLLPAAFLGAVEHDPVGIALGEWVIHSALAQLQAWAAQGLHTSVSVNVGAYQLQHPGFVESLAAALRAHPEVRAQCLELEVIETSALEDLQQVARVLQGCLRLGVHFALDDFGTGYSSLAYLKRLPVAQLKIDQSFVRDMLEDPDDLAILDGVIGLAQAFRCEVIAEGVESVEHGSILLRLGCEHAQGWGIARAMPAQELAAWAGQWRPDPSWENTRTLQREHLALLHAAIEHRAWVTALEAYVHGQREAPPELSPQRCHFGRWLAQRGQQAGSDPAAMEQVDALHRQAHECGQAIAELVQHGQSEQARSALAQLHTLRDALLQALRDLLMP